MKKDKAKLSLSSLTMVWLCGVILLSGIVYAIIYASHPDFHDDLSYFVQNYLWIETHDPIWLRFPRRIIGMWFDLNGRINDSTNPLWLNILPRQLTGIMEGVMMAGMYVRTILWTRRLGYHSAMSVIACAFMMFALPWWDGYGLLVVQINYLWGATLALFVTYFILCRPPRNLIQSLLLAIPALITGAWHEALGFPLAIALIIALIAVPSLRRRNTLIPTLAAIIGGFYTITSPALWHRIASAGEPDDPFLPLTLKTIPVAVLLIIILIILFCRNRKSLWHRLSSPDTCCIGIFTALSLTSAVIAVGSGIGGRSGWFAETFAFLAIIGLIHPYISKRLRGVTERLPYRLGTTLCTWALLSLMTAQTICYFRYQREADRESRELVARYLASPDGVVIANLPTDNDQPLLLLNRVHGMPPLYEDWTRRELMTYRAYTMIPAVAPSPVYMEGVKTAPALLKEAYEKEPIDFIDRGKTPKIEIYIPQIKISPPEVAEIIDRAIANKERQDNKKGRSIQTPIRLPNAIIYPEGGTPGAKDAEYTDPSRYPYLLHYRNHPILLYIPTPPGDRPDHQ